MPANTSKGNIFIDISGMKSVLAQLLLWTVFLSGPLFGQSGNPTAADLKVKVTAMEPGAGSIVACLVSESSQFLHSCQDSIKVSAENGDEQMIVFRHVPAGQYAISIFQDRNNNQTLDANFLKIPKERFGFSNNPRLKMGGPQYEDCSFTKGPGTDSLTIELRKLF